jgi:hypothetical protein
MRGDPATSSQKWLKSAHETGGDWSYGGRMPRPEQNRTDADPRTMRTKAGEEITADLADVLVAEAEQGYDLAKAKRCRIKESAANAQDPSPAKLEAVRRDDEEPTDEDLRTVEEARLEPRIS